MFDAKMEIIFIALIVIAVTFLSLAGYLAIKRRWKDAIIAGLLCIIAVLSFFLVTDSLVDAIHRARENAAKTQIQSLKEQLASIKQEQENNNASNKGKEHTR